MPATIPPLRIATRLATVLAAVKQKITSDGIVDPTLCFASLQSHDETVARAPAGEFVKIFLEESRAYAPGVTGGGNALLVFECIWTIGYFLRYAVDVDY